MASKENKKRNEGNCPYLVKISYIPEIEEDKAIEMTNNFKGNGNELNLVSRCSSEDGMTTISISLLLVVGLLSILLLQVSTYYK